jgi:hypothetical protein
MSITYTLQTSSQADEVVHEALAEEEFTDLDRARGAALELCSCFGVDVQVVQHFGAASNVWETYDFVTYGGYL